MAIAERIGREIIGPGVPIDQVIETPMNGSPGFDFGTQINALDWYKKQQSAKLASGGLKNLKLQTPSTDWLNITVNKPSISKKDESSSIGGFMNSKAGKFGGQYGRVIGDTASAIGDMIGKRGLDGKYGGITKGMDTAYDTIQKAASNFGPIGNIVSGAMGVGKLVGNAVSKIGGGTDGMTKTDAILNSAFLNLTPLGLINGFGGKKANTYTRNAELDRSTNGGFQGFLTTQDVTQIGAGKKYGLFSSGARNKQNQLTEFTSNMKHTISGIVDTNTINNLAAQGSTPFIANQQSVDLSGGVQQMRAARHGMQFNRRVISKYAIGNKISNNDPRVKAMQARFGNNQEKLKQNIADGTVKPIAKDDSRALDMNKRFGYRREYTDLATAPIGTIMQRYNINKPAVSPTSYSEELKFSEFNPSEMYTSSFMNPQSTSNNIVNNSQSNSNQTAASIGVEQPTWDKNATTQQQPTQQPTNQSFNYTTPGIQSVIDGWNLFGRKKKGFVGDVVGRYQQGNKLKRTFKTVDVATGKYVEIPRDLDKDQIKGRTPIRLYNGTVVFMNGDGTVTSDRWEVIGQREHLTPKGQEGMKVEEFKQGGQMNVIPEGALHARLNHLDQINDDLTHVTTKGIPVITKEGGEVVQHAEIEHSEIIFTLDVTNKIEDLRKKWHEDKEDKYAIEAGKLLVKEILHNTDDRTNLIESVE